MVRKTPQNKTCGHRELLFLNDAGKLTTKIVIVESSS